VLRHGLKPQVTRFTSHAGHDRSLIEHVRTSFSSLASTSGDIGILTPTSYAAGEVSKVLAAVGLRSPSRAPATTTAHRWEAIKVGTIKPRRASSSEKPGACGADAPRLSPQTVTDLGGHSQNREARDRREELYVAILLMHGMGCVGGVA
jgi:hypothetical protein